MTGEPAGVTTGSAVAVAYTAREPIGSVVVVADTTREAIGSAVVVADTAEEMTGSTATFTLAGRLLAQSFRSLGK